MLSPLTAICPNGHLLIYTLSYKHSVQYWRFWFHGKKSEQSFIATEVASINTSDSKWCGSTGSGIWLFIEPLVQVLYWIYTFIFSSFLTSDLIVGLSWSCSSKNSYHVDVWGLNQFLSIHNIPNDLNIKVA